MLADNPLSPEELRARRKALGLSQAALAERLGVTATTVARWERSEQRVGNPERLSAALARLGRQDEPSRALYGSNAATVVAASKPGNNLPEHLTELIGRTDDVAAAEQLLVKNRLLTITGPGGIGKTRLALQVAANCAAEYRDGVWLVELASLSDAALVAQMVARALGVRQRTGRAVLSTLEDVLRDRCLLLVLDNCEHLVEACGELAHALLTRCRSLRILSTSREPLCVDGEITWRVPPLNVPLAGNVANANDLSRSPAAMLFVERARAAVPRFTVTDQNAAAIADICRRLDGMPLALELAAARVRVLSVEQIAARLDDRFALLASGKRSAPVRHQTLRAAVQWSFELLDSEERRLFQQISVFAGGWTVEAAAAVAERSATGLVNLLARLVDKSLVLAELWSGQQRYHQLETLRQFGHERLEASGVARAIRLRHATYYLALAEQAADQLRGSSGPGWLDQLDLEHDNLRIALDWFVQSQDVERAQRLCGALLQFWNARGHLQEAWDSAHEVQQLPGADAPALPRLKVLAGMSAIAWSRSDNPTAESLCQEALNLAATLGADHAIAGLLAHLGNLVRIRYAYPEARRRYAEALVVARHAPATVTEGEVLVNLGRLDYLEGDLESAQAAFVDSLRLFRRADYGLGVLQALRYLGEVALDRGEYASALSYMEKGIAQAREIRDPWRTAWAATTLGYPLVARGELDRARQAWSENLLAWETLGNVNLVGAALEGLGFVEARQCNDARAVRLAGAGEGIRRAHDLLMYPESELWLRRWLPDARKRLGEPTAASVWREGEVMSVAEAIGYALDRTDALQPSTLREALTTRELEVAALIGRGLSDREIASELVISEHTAHHHVRNILGKLGLTRRAQVAARIVHGDAVSSTNSRS